MTARISKHTRALIIDELSRSDSERLSQRAIAKKYGVSLSTVQRWKGRIYLDDRPRNPAGQPGLTKFEKQIFTAIASVTRYPWRYLCEYLTPVLPSLPTQEKKELSGELSKQLDESEDQVKFWSDTTIRRLVNEHPDESMRLKGQISAIKRPKAQPGVVVVHRILIEWKEQGRRVKGDLLILVERSSGLIYAKVYPKQVNERSIALCIGRFDQVIPFGIKGLRFIVRISEGTQDSVEAWQSSVLDLEINGPINQQSEEQFVRAVKQKLQNDMTTGSSLNDNDLDIEISHDVPLAYEQVRIEIPGDFSSKKNLNACLTELVNKINTTVRGYYFYDYYNIVTPAYLLMVDRSILGDGKRIRSRVGSLNSIRRIKVGAKVKISPRKTHY